MAGLIRNVRMSSVAFATRAVANRTAMTQALVLNKVNDIELKDIDVNEPFTADDLRIDIAHVGICGSDLHYYEHGDLGPFHLKEPMILGHEAAGTVAEVGENLKHRFKVGDRVCMEPGVPDFTSQETLRGMYNLDKNLRFWATPPPEYAKKLQLEPRSWAAGHGCLRPSVVHPGAFTFKLPDAVKFEWGAMVEPLAVAMHSCTKAAIKPGDVAVVCGAGPIGMLTTMTALASGCSHVFVTDISEAKCKIAETLSPGAITGMVVGSDEKVAEAVKQVYAATDGWGANVVFECAGNHRAAQATTRFAGCGGRVLLVGCPSQNPALDVGDLQTKELSVQGVFRYANVYPQALALLASGKLNLDLIITNRFKFEQSVEAFDFMLKPPGDTVKSIISMK
eukprot:TRINITY_DN9632_c0_g1_i2.p1 TRINITY_DN9632_c0_g1~~TRINITY_DN9632_c0_g1_i2.p1  ORF type:complete len:416 (+),score=94.09 TRINITY_DN9632_c0_g1_i2:69-1250(+)